MADQQPANEPPHPASVCEIDNPNHDHDGLWWSAADELEAMCARNRGEPSPAEPGQGSAVIPRHELPGRIVLTIGLFTSSLCVVGILLLVG